MKKEFKTEQRIFNILKENRERFSDSEFRQVYYAFEKLIVLKKGFSDSIMRMNEQTFYLAEDKYKAKMNWINEFMASKGIGIIFTDINDYKASSDDYDYYYEFKTPTQYKEEEEKRKTH